MTPDPLIYEFTGTMRRSIAVVGTFQFRATIEEAETPERARNWVATELDVLATIHGADDRSIWLRLDDADPLYTLAQREMADPMRRVDVEAKWCDWLLEQAEKDAA